MLIPCQLLTFLTQCDGNIPCQRCRDAGEPCDYSRNRYVSKDELRAEIAQLKKALAVSQDRYVPQRPFPGSGAEPGKDSSESAERVRGFLSQTSTSLGAAQTKDATAEAEQPSDLPCFHQLLSWRSCRSELSDSHLLGKRPEQSTILSLPPLPRDAYVSQSRTDTWTDTGWTRAHIRHLFDVLFTWDYLPFCLLCKDLFLQDYNNGSNKYCSSAFRTLRPSEYSRSTTCAAGGRRRLRSLPRRLPRS